VKRAMHHHEMLRNLEAIERFLLIHEKIELAEAINTAREELMALRRQLLGAMKEVRRLGGQLSAAILEIDDELEKETGVTRYDAGSRVAGDQ